MTDFLRNLAARSFGTETAIRPRLASLFELAPGLNSALQRAPAPQREEPELATEAASDASSNPLRTSDARPHSGLHTEPRLKGEPSPPVSSRNESGTSARVHGATAKPIARGPALDGDSSSSHSSAARDAGLVVPERLSGREVEREGIDARVSHPRVSAISQTADTNGVTVVLPANDDRGLRGEKTTTLRLSSPLGHGMVEERSSLVYPSQGIVGLAARMKDAAAAMGANPGAPRSDSASRSAQSNALEPDPSVHVTIGRIEVRAVPEKNRATGARAASPVMGLEEYLQRRAQRGGQ